jgi:hypothetical protein
LRDRADVADGPRSARSACDEGRAARALPVEARRLAGPTLGRRHGGEGGPEDLRHLAIRHGADVRYAPTSRILAELAGGHADHTWPRRLAELARPNLLILDDFAMRELTTTHADDLYELIAERTRPHRSLLLASNRAPLHWYPLLPNAVVAEPLLDGLINTSHQVFMNGPSYAPNKRPGRPEMTGKEVTR